MTMFLIGTLLTISGVLVHSQVPTTSFEPTYMPTITRYPTKSPLKPGQFCNDRGLQAAYTETFIEKNGETLRVIEANGCPNHKSRCINKDDDYCLGLGNTLTDATPQNYRVRVPAVPCIADKPTNTTCKGGMIGILRNGVAIFSPRASDGCASAWALESDSFDHCGSSHSTYRYNMYHVHGNPTCLLDQINQNVYPKNREFSHDHIIGWAFDGFPIYGPNKADGKNRVMPCQYSDDENECLDGCNGHFNDHVDDGFVYHYHLTGEVSEGVFKPGASRLFQPQPTEETEKFWPFTIGCYRGIMSDWSQANFRWKDEPEPVCASPGVSDGFVPVPRDGFTDLYVGDQCSYPTCSARVCKNAPNKLCSARMADPSILVDIENCADPCGVVKCSACGRQAKCKRDCQRRYGRREFDCAAECGEVQGNYKCLSGCTWR